tara:strand:- start:408 stop:1052 length:645 start_codon:yes stop_codon:yes gene_type:complete
MAKSRKKVALEESNSWLLTYSDVVTLLVAFFVLLIATSQVDEGKLEDVKQGLSIVSDSESQTPMQDLSEQVETIIKEQELASIKVKKVIDGIKIELDSENLYESGSASLKPEGKKILVEFTKAINSVDLDHRNIVIEGHSDDVPIRNAEFHNNWELSSARAIEVTLHLIDLGVDKSKLRAVSYADSQPRANKELPIAEQRQQNRRVVIYIKRAI